MAGNLEAETDALLSEFDIKDCEFSPTLIAVRTHKMQAQHFWIHIQGIPDKFELKESELAYRKDLREEWSVNIGFVSPHGSCTSIFTIDPATAKDLDDALSCVKLENGNFRVSWEALACMKLLIVGGCSHC